MPPTRHLGIGEMIVSAEPVVISTLLGSCVSVAVYSPLTQIGGLIHYALPSASAALGSGRGPLHFGDRAISALVAELSRLSGTTAGSFEAKIVGGAAVLDSLSAGSEIGIQNIAIARRELKRLNLRVTGEKVGGRRGYKLFFRTDTGGLRVAELRDSAGL